MTEKELKTINHDVDFCVIGGGIAGMSAAIQAARHGLKTLLMQERPVFGGNASSEIRMWVSGVHGWLETGLIEEIRLENRYRNPTVNYSIWDSILYEKVIYQENLTALLNCTCMDAEMDDTHIVSVTGWQMTTQQFHKINAKIFADCSGDSILAPLTGAEFRIGREKKTEFDESLAQEEPDTKTMGMSCIMQGREMSTPQPFTPPKWAYCYPDDSCFPEREHTMSVWQNFWWLELGGNQDSIGDTETIREELLKTAFGLWDHMKNHGDHGMDNWALDWVGFLPGKRESRRYVGDIMICQHDVLSGGKFDDTIAYGGWPIDDHHPDGFKHFGPPNTNIRPKEPYGISLRALYSKNIDNLVFAGRNISVTHAALSSSRVMATCSLLGQAIGSLAATAVSKHLLPRATAQNFYKEIQHQLLEDDCYLPGFKRSCPAISAKAVLTASCGNPELLRNGIDRDIPEQENAWLGQEGDYVEYDFGTTVNLSSIRLVFDSDFTRMSCEMRSNYFLSDAPLTPPNTLISDFHLEADGVEIASFSGNYQRLVTIKKQISARKLRLVIDKTRTPGAKKVFAFDAR